MLLLILTIGLLPVVSAVAQPTRQGISGKDISNPYYAKRQWHVWTIDSTQQEQLPKEFKLTPVAKRVFPDDKSLLSMMTRDSKFAGCWDDVYVSQDDFHSSISTTWQDGDGRQVELTGQFPILKRGYYQFQVRGNQVVSPVTAELKRLGTNFTSQSTNGMGHDIANNPLQTLVLEREFYFADILRSGPAHVSYREVSSGPTVDEYQALVPAFFNSVGSSGSETWALTKMVIAGAHLRTDLKKEIKRHGIYPATLLYLWKAALPYDAPYASEMRHRVAYFADGEDREQRGMLQADGDTLSHRYDDGLHMRSMAELASSLTAAPPVAVLGHVGAVGGKLVYGLRTAALVVQEKKDVVMTVSTRDSYDIQELPVEMTLTRICGNPNTLIEETSPGVFQITVPFDEKLPKGRTSILAVANNGHTDGNPAVINIYNASGNANQRPNVSLNDRYTVAPGRRLRVQLDVEDPEGFPVTFTKRSDEPGEVSGNTLTWSCPPDTPQGDYPVTLITSDNTSGSSFRSVQLPIEVRTVVAQMEADADEGEVPFVAQFSAENSAGVQGAKLTYQWDFGDGQTSTELAPRHRFEQPGYYQVTVTVAGTNGSDTVQKVFHARHDWPWLFNNGWNKVTVRPWNWLPTGPEITADVSGYEGRPAMHVIVKERSPERKAVELARPFEPPCFLRIGFSRGNKIPGAGIGLFGAVFGRGRINPAGERPRFADDLSFSQLSADGTVFDSSLIANYPRNPSGPSQLRLYVTEDPLSPGEYRYAGYFTCEGVEKFFSFGERKLTDEKIAILGGELGSQFVSEFNVWGRREKRVASSEK